MGNKQVLCIDTTKLVGLNMMEVLESKMYSDLSEAWFLTVKYHDAVKNDPRYIKIVTCAALINTNNELVTLFHRTPKPTLHSIPMTKVLPLANNEGVVNLSVAARKSLISLIEEKMSIDIEGDKVIDWDITNLRTVKVIFNPSFSTQTLFLLYSAALPEVKTLAAKDVKIGIHNIKHNEVLNYEKDALLREAHNHLKSTMTMSDIAESSDSVPAFVYNEYRKMWVYVSKEDK